MKLTKILVAVATVSVVSVATAEVIPAGTAILAGLNTNAGAGAANGPATGVSAVAVVTDCNTRNALQDMQDMSSCLGNNSKLCAPNISSAELRAMLTGSVAVTTAISGSKGTLASSITSTAGTAGCAAPAIGSNTGIQFRHATGTNDAVDQFLGSATSINGLVVGAGAAKTTSARADDADCLVNITANTRVRLCTVHATSLSDSNNAGFVKLDGAAPDLANLMSSNYNMVSNLHGLVPSTTVSAHSTIFGAYVANTVAVAGDPVGMDGDGVAYHNAGGSPFAAAPLSTRGSNPDLDSKGK